MSGRKIPRKFGAGFGCIYFVPKKEYGRKESPDLKSFFEKHVYKALNKISAISKLEIKLPPSLVFQDFSQLIGFSDYGKNLDEAPYILGLEINFEINISKEYQNNFFKKMEGFEHNLNDTIFLVKIEYNYYCPIFSIISKEMDIPSSAVVLVREYLNKEFDSDTENNVCIETLGPTPLHCEYLLESVAGNHRDISVKHTPRPGYEKIEVNFSFDSEVGFEDSIYYLFFTLYHELDSFYEMVKNKNRMSLECKNVLEMWGEEVLIHNSNFLWRNLRRFDEGRRIEKISRNILEVDFERGRLIQRLKSKYEQTYSELECPEMFSRLAKSELSEIEEMPFEKILTHIEFLESRRINRSILWVTLVSAILGGVVGGVLGSEKLQSILGRLGGQAVQSVNTMAVGNSQRNEKPSQTKIPTVGQRISSN